MSTNKKRLLGWLSAPLLIAVSLPMASSTAEAARGGRIGGSSFRKFSRPNYGGGLRRRGGYTRNYRRGVFNVPFIIPIFGFGGGGGLFSLIILMAVLGVFLNARRY